MKRNLYLLVLVFVASISVNASSLYLRFTNQASYTVTIDGIYYQVNGANFRIPAIRPGRHFLIIESYTLNRNPRRCAMPVVIYNGPLMIREASDIFASVDYRGFHVDRVIPNRYNNNRRRHYHYRYNEMANKYEGYEDDTEYDNYDNNQYQRNDNGNNNRRNNDYEYRREDNYGGDRDRNYEEFRNRRYMEQRDFEALKRSVNDASFDNTKKTVAMSAISSNNLSIVQIRELLGLFSFESTRLEIAKYAYNYTDDKSRFYELTDAFTFDSNKKEIAALSGTR